MCDNVISMNQVEGMNHPGEILRSTLEDTLDAKVDRLYRAAEGVRATDHYVRSRAGYASGPFSMPQKSHSQLCRALSGPVYPKSGTDTYLYQNFKLGLDFHYFLFTSNSEYNKHTGENWIETCLFTRGYKKWH